MTSAEQVSVLDEQFEASMGEYDGMMQRERDYALSRGGQGDDSDEGPDYEGVPYDETGGSQGPSEEGAGDGEVTIADAPPIPSGGGSAPYEEGPEGAAGGGYRPPGPGDGREGDYNHSGGAAAPPEDIPDGSDDDVVARQIREAAMKETDPDLREKLWEEYRKYKNEQQ